MATRRRAGSAYRKSEYIHGSAARQLQAVPKREPDRHEAPGGISSQTLKNRRRAARMSVQYVLFLVVATVVTLAVVIGYLQLTSEVGNRSKRIHALELQIKDTKAENDANYNDIMKKINLEEIRRVAIEELHMVYAQKNQVIFYETEESDYVRQYEDIPEMDKETFGEYLQN